MESDREMCHRCKRVTEWRLLRGGRRLRCDGCGDIFPCQHICTHLDCAQVRQELAA